MSKSDLSSFGNNFRVTFKNMTEERFEKKVKEIWKVANSKSTTGKGIHALARKAVILYLTLNRGRDNIPNIVTGNLSKNIAQSHIVEAIPKKTVTGSVLSYSWTTRITPDMDAFGNSTVLSSDGRKARYAYFLNVGKNFTRYHGYFDTVVRVYKESMSAEMNGLISSKFKGQYYRY